MEDLKSKITELAGSVAKQYAFELVGVEFSGSSRKLLIRVFIDKDKGVTLDDCGEFSRALSAILDVEDPVPMAYVLEVSSPGLDRPLKALKDFQRSIGKLVRIVTKTRIEEQNVVTGRLSGISGESITLSFDDREIIIPFDQISKARLEIELK